MSQVPYNVGQTNPPLMPHDLPAATRPATTGDISAVIGELREIRGVLQEIRALLEKQNKSGD
jgi:hypothetical protein